MGARYSAGWCRIRRNMPLASSAYHQGRKKRKSIKTNRSLLRAPYSGETGRHQRQWPCVRLDHWGSCDGKFSERNGCNSSRYKGAFFNFALWYDYQRSKRISNSCFSFVIRPLLPSLHLSFRPFCFPSSSTFPSSSSLSLPFLLHFSFCPPSPVLALDNDDPNEGKNAKLRYRITQVSILS